MKYSKEEKTLEESKHDLINFDNENLKTKTASVLFIKGRIQLSKNGTHRRRM